MLALSAMAFGTDDVKMVAFPGGKCYMVRLLLNDKSGTPYSLSHPEAFLSEKAIMRRKAEGLPIDSTDLPVSPNYLLQLKAQGVDIVCKSKWNNSVVVLGKSLNALKSLADLPFVRSEIKVWTSPDSLSQPTRRLNYHTEFNRWDTVPQSNYGITEEQIKQINGMALHRAGFTGKGMTIAVLDGGFMNADKIPSFQSIKIAGTADFVYPHSKDIYREMEHGTKVLSAMGVNMPGTFMGTAPDATYWLIRCENEQTETLAEEDYWAAAVEFADSVGVDVINSSLGFHAFDEKEMDHQYRELDGRTALISRTASMLANKGIILVNSAGNDGMGAWKKINFPCDALDILVVGLVSPNGVNAAFSAVGPTADGRIKPDVMALGSPTAVVSGRGTVIHDMGTSFSAPLVCGMVACLWQALHWKNAKEIIDLVRKSGSNSQYPDNIFGYGIPDFGKAFLMGKQN